MDTLILDYRLGRQGATGARLWALVLIWRQRARQRRQLAELSDRQLSDIGIDRLQAAQEAGKPFWRP